VARRVPRTRRGSPSRAPRAPRDMGSFSNWLRRESRLVWLAAINHRFIRELSHDKLDLRVYKRYLVNEYFFVQASLTTCGYAIASAPTMPAKCAWALAAHSLATSQRQYFQDAFAILSVSPDRCETQGLDRDVLAFRDLVISTAAQGRYEDILTVTLATEWMYLVWSKAAAHNLPSHPLYSRWIELHITPEFESHVMWMRRELDDLGIFLTCDRRRALAHLFERTLQMEIAFHDAAYREGV
jgi:thiaminase/transcriptional activator TenA